MRSGGGKSKGASFERDVCRKLSLWISYGLQEDVYWRSAMSGGRATVAFGKGKRLAAQAGDITCIHPVGQLLTDKFMVECKHYRNLQFEGLFTGNGVLVQFWRKLCADAVKYGKKPMLIAKQNRLPTIVILDNEKHRPYAESAVFVPKEGAVIILFEEFLKWKPNYLLDTA